MRCILKKYINISAGEESENSSDEKSGEDSDSDSNMSEGSFSIVIFLN